MRGLDEGRDGGEAAGDGVRLGLAFDGYFLPALRHFLELDVASEEGAIRESFVPCCWLVLETVVCWTT